MAVQPEAAPAQTASLAELQQAAFAPSSSGRRRRGHAPGPLAKTSEELPELADAQRAIQTVRNHAGPIERFKELLDGTVTDGDAVEALGIIDAIMPADRGTILRSLPQDLVALLLDQLPEAPSAPFRRQHAGGFVSVLVYLGEMDTLRWYLERSPTDAGFQVHMHEEAALLLDAMSDADLRAAAAGGPHVAAYKQIVAFVPSAHIATLERVDQLCDEATEAKGQSEKAKLKTQFSTGASSWPPQRVKAVARTLRSMGEGAFVEETAKALGIEMPAERELKAAKSRGAAQSGAALLADGALSQTEGVLELEDVLGVAGMADDYQLADLGKERGAANKLHFKRGKDWFSVRIPLAVLAGVRTVSGATAIQTGPLAAQGLWVDLKWPSADSAESWFKMELEALVIDHVLRATADGALNLGTLKLNKLRIEAAGPPKNGDRPDDKMLGINAGGIQYALKLFSDLLPGFARVVEAASEAVGSPEAVGEQLAGAFPALDNAELRLGGMSIDGVDTSGGAHLGGVALTAMGVIVKTDTKDELLLRQANAVRERLAGDLKPAQRAELEAHLTKLDGKWKKAKAKRERLDELTAKGDEKLTEVERAERNELRRLLNVTTTKAGFKDFTVKGAELGETFVDEARLQNLRAKAATWDDTAGTQIDASATADVSVRGVVRGAEKTRFDQRLAAYTALRDKSPKSAEDEVRLEDLDKTFKPVIKDMASREELRKKVQQGQAGKEQLEQLNAKLAIWDEPCPDLLVGAMRGRLSASVGAQGATAGLDAVELSDVQLGELHADRVGVGRVAASAKGESIISGDLTRLEAQATNIEAEGITSGVEGQQGYKALASATAESAGYTFDASQHGGMMQARLKGMKLEELELQAKSNYEALCFRRRVATKEKDRLEARLAKAEGETADSLKGALKKVQARLKRALRQEKRYDKLQKREARAQTRQGKRWWRKQLTQWNAAVATSVKELTFKDLTLTAIQGGRDFGSFAPNAIGVQSSGVSTQDASHGDLSVDAAEANGLNGLVSLDGSGDFSMQADSAKVHNLKKGTTRVRRIDADGAVMSGGGDSPTLVEAQKGKAVGVKAGGIAVGGAGFNKGRVVFSEDGTMHGGAQNVHARDVRVHSRTKANNAKGQKASRINTRVRHAAAYNARFSSGPSGTMFGAHTARGQGVEVDASSAGKNVTASTDAFTTRDVSYRKNASGVNVRMGRSTLEGVTAGVVEGEDTGNQVTAQELAFNRLVYGANKDGAQHLNVDGITLKDAEAGGEWGSLQAAGTTKIADAWYQEKDGVVGVGVKGLEGAVEYEGTEPLRLPNGEVITGGGANLDVSHAKVTQREGRTEIAYGVVRGRKVYLTKPGGEKQAVLKLLRMGRRGKVSNVVIQSDKSIDGELFALRLVTEDGVKLPLDSVKAAVSGDLTVGRIEMKRLKPSDIAAAGSGLVLDDIRLSGKAVVNGNEVFVDAFQVGELAALGLGEGLLQVGFDWLDVRGRVNGETVSGKVKSSIKDVGALVSVGDSPELLAGWLGQMKNDVSLTVSINPDEAQKPEKRQGLKLALDVLRKTDVWVYANHLDIGPAKNVEAIAAIKNGRVDPYDIKGSGEYEGARVRIIGALQAIISGELGEQKNVAGYLEKLAASEGNQAKDGDNKPVLTPKALNKMHLAVSAKNVQGGMAATTDDVAVRGDFAGGELHGGKRSNAGPNLSAENLLIQNVRIDALQHILGVSSVSLPSLTVQVSSPEQKQTSVSIEIDNSHIDGVRFGPKTSKEGSP